MLSILTSICCCQAQPQQAWVVRYNGGYSNKTHTPLAMALDAAGDIFVAGTSQNAGNLNDYVALKYTPAGQQLWAVRHSSTNGRDFTLNGFALDRGGKVHLTGTGGTLKLGTNGAVEWVAPYAGKDVAVDTDGNVYVTGFSTTMFATVKLDAAGSNQWVRTHAQPDFAGEPTESQKVVVDELGQVFVAGWEAWGAWFRCDWTGTNFCHYSQPLMIAYSTNGVALWTNAYMGGLHHLWGDTKGLMPDNRGNVYVTGNGDDGYQTAKISSGGQTAWLYSFGSPLVSAIGLDSSGNVFLTGRRYLTIKLFGGNGQHDWFSLKDSGCAYGIALDRVGNIHVTGVTNAVASMEDILTIQYDGSGNEQWGLRYNGPANGNDGGTAIAVAPDGSIYVAGFSANEAGGTDIVLIKYGGGTSIQRQPDGSMRLWGMGAPGSNYTFQAATDLLHWADLGCVPAGTNGLFQFTDTNAPLFPHRFYRWHTP